MPAIFLNAVPWEESANSFQDTLETSLCARNTLPACYGPGKS